MSRECEGNQREKEQKTEGEAGEREIAVRLYAVYVHGYPSGWVIRDPPELQCNQERCGAREVPANDVALHEFDEIVPT